MRPRRASAGAEVRIAELERKLVPVEPIEVDVLDYMSGEDADTLRRIIDVLDEAPPINGEPNLDALSEDQVVALDRILDLLPGVYPRRGDNLILLFPVDVQDSDTLPEYEQETTHDG